MSKQTILYVEDDAFSREIMSILIDDYPEYDLIMYPDSHDFESRITTLPDDLALVMLDIHVAPIDGFEMLKLLRRNEKFAETPVLALTASVMHQEIVTLRSDGFNGAIAKPIDQDMFNANITSVINGEQVWSIIGA